MEQESGDPIGHGSTLSVLNDVHRSLALFLRRDPKGRIVPAKDHGEFKAYAIEKFRGILHSVVKSSIKTNSPIPPWLKTRWSKPGTCRHYEPQLATESESRTQTSSASRGKAGEFESKRRTASLPGLFISGIEPRRKSHAKDK